MRNKVFANTTGFDYFYRKTDNVKYRKMQKAVLNGKPYDFYRLRENIRKAGGLKQNRGDKKRMMQYAIADKDTDAIRKASVTFEKDPPRCMRNFPTKGAADISRVGTKVWKHYKDFIVPYNEKFDKNHTPRASGADVEVAEDDLVESAELVQTKLEATPDQLRLIKQHILKLPSSGEAEMVEVVGMIDNVLAETARLLDPSDVHDESAAAAAPTKKKIAILGPTRAGKSFLINAFLESTQMLQSQYNLARSDLEQNYPWVIDPASGRTLETNPRRFYPAELLERVAEMLNDELGHPEEEFQERQGELESRVTDFSPAPRSAYEIIEDYRGGKAMLYFTKDKKFNFVKPSFKAVDHKTGKIKRDGPLGKELGLEEDRKEFLKTVRDAESTAHVPKRHAFFLRSFGDQNAVTQTNHTIWGGGHYSATVKFMTAAQVQEHFAAHEWEKEEKDLDEGGKRQRGRLLSLLNRLVNPIPSSDTPEEIDTFIVAEEDMITDRKPILGNDGKPIEMKYVANMLSDGHLVKVAFPGSVLCEDMLGRYTTYVGVGKSMDDDRIFVASMLSLATEHKIRSAFIGDIHVVVPNHFLKSTTALVDIPGLGEDNDQAFMKMSEGVDDADAVMVFIHNTMRASKQVTDTMKDLDLLGRLDRKTLDSVFVVQVREKIARRAVKLDGEDSILDSITLDAEEDEMCTDLTRSLKKMLVTSHGVKGVRDTTEAIEWLRSRNMLHTSAPRAGFSAYPLVMLALQFDRNHSLSEDERKMRNATRMGPLIAKICSCLGVSSSPDFEQVKNSLNGLLLKLFKDGVTKAGDIDDRLLLKGREIPAALKEAAGKAWDATKPADNVTVTPAVGREQNRWLRSVTTPAERKQAKSSIQTKLELVDAEKELLDAWAKDVAATFCEIVGVDDGAEDSLYAPNHHFELTMRLQDQLCKLCSDEPELLNENNAFMNRVFTPSLLRIDMTKLQQIVRQMLLRVTDHAIQTDFIKIAKKLLEVHGQGDLELDLDLVAGVLSENENLKSLKDSARTFIRSAFKVRKPKNDKSLVTSLICAAAKELLKDHIGNIVPRRIPRGQFSERAREAFDACFKTAHLSNPDVRGRIEAAIVTVALKKLKDLQANIVKKLHSQVNVKRYIRSALKEISMGQCEDAHAEKQNQELRNAIDGLKTAGSNLEVKEVSSHASLDLLDKLAKFEMLDQTRTKISGPAFNFEVHPNRHFRPKQTSNVLYSLDGCAVETSEATSPYALEECLAEIITGTTKGGVPERDVLHLRELVLAHMYVNSETHCFAAAVNERVYRDGHQASARQNDASSLAFLESFCHLYNIKVWVVLTKKNDQDKDVEYFHLSSNSGYMSNAITSAPPEVALQWNPQSGFSHYEKPARSGRLRVTQSPLPDSVRTFVVPQEERRQKQDAYQQNKSSAESVHTDQEEAKLVQDRMMTRRPSNGRVAREFHEETTIKRANAEGGFTPSPSSRAFAPAGQSPTPSGGGGRGSPSNRSAGGSTSGGGGRRSPSPSASTGARGGGGGSGGGGGGSRRSRSPFPKVARARPSRSGNRAGDCRAGGGGGGSRQACNTNSDSRSGRGNGSGGRGRNDEGPSDGAAPSGPATTTENTLRRTRSGSESGSEPKSKKPRN